MRYTPATMWPVVLIPLAVLVVFPAFWCGVVWLIGQFGWRRLAEAYGTDAPITGRTFRMTSASIGAANYGNSLTISIEPDGLRIAPLFLFRPGHPPVLIPWDEVEDIRPRKVLWHTSYALDTATPKPVTIRLPERIIEAIRDELAEARGPGSAAKPTP